jgi:WD40 repeat protein
MNRISFLITIFSLFSLIDFSSTQTSGVQSNINLKSLVVKQELIYSRDFVYNGQEVLYGDQGGLFFWDNKWKMKEKFGKSYAVFDMLKLDETRFITRENAGEAKVYDMNTKVLLLDLVGEGSFSCILDFAEFNANYIAFGTEKGSIVIYNKFDFTVIKSFGNVNSPIAKLIVVGGVFLYAGHRDGTIYKWDLTTFQMVKQVYGYKDTFSDLIKISDTILFKSDQEGNITIFDKDYPSKFVKVGYTGNKLYFNPTDGLILCTSPGNEFKILNTDAEVVSSFPVYFGAEGRFKYVAELDLIAFIGNKVVLLGN